MKKRFSQKIIKAAVVLLVIAGAFSCDKNEEYSSSPDPDLAKAILGKWELAALQNGSDEKLYEPTGYVEYLPDSLMGWYDYATKKYEILPEKYWFDSIPYSERENDWMLHYTHVMNYEYDPERTPGNICECYFINANKMYLPHIDLLAFAPMPNYIYKRKK